MDAAQLSSEVPISAVRRYWIGRRTRFNDPCEVQSMLCYGQHMLRTDILNRLWAWTEQQNLKCGTVRLFGGLVRREIEAHHHHGRMLQDTPEDFMYEAFQTNKAGRGSPFHVSEKCFVPEGTDMDIFFETVADIKKLLITLKGAYDYRVVGGIPSVKETRYHGCQVWHLEISQKLQIFGPRVVVRLDLVTRTVPEVILLPDFSVNQLQVDQDGALGLFTTLLGTSSLVVESIRRSKVIARTIDMIEARQTDLMMYSWDHYRSMMMHHCRALEDTAPGRAMVHSVSLDDAWDPYVQGTDPETRPYYARYISCLIRHRLRKMLRDKWTITNMTIGYQTTGSLHMQCGHQWGFRNGDLQVQDESGVRIRCPVCQSVDTIARSFVA